MGMSTLVPMLIESEQEQSGVAARIQSAPVTNSSMDRDDYLRFQSVADRLGSDAENLHRFYAAAADWNISHEEAEALLKDWQGPGRTLFRTDTERALLFRGLVLAALEPPD
jgi:phage tail sheath protein FI